LAVVLYVEIRTASSGDALPFLLWNCAPMVSAIGLVFASRAAHLGLRCAAYGFALGEAAPVVYWHIMWAFDIEKVATGSSTSALLFLFLPAMAITWGAIAAIPAGMVGFLLDRYRSSRNARHEAG
jgi:hypothetical protein